MVLLEQFIAVLGRDLRKPVASIAPAQGPCEGRMDEGDGRFRACKAASHECPRSTGEGLTLNHGADELLESALGVLSQQPPPGAAATMRAIKSS